MIIWNTVKFACEKCQSGHRNSSCAHVHNASLLEIKGKGRPASQCPHCRTARLSTTTSTVSSAVEIPSANTSSGSCCSKAANDQEKSHSCCGQVPLSAETTSGSTSSTPEAETKASCCGKASTQNVTSCCSQVNANGSQSASIDEPIPSTSYSSGPIMEGGLQGCCSETTSAALSEPAKQSSSCGSPSSLPSNIPQTTTTSFRSHHHKCKCGSEPPKDRKQTVKVFFEQEQAPVTGSRKRKVSSPTQLTLHFEPTQAHLTQLEVAVASKTPLELVVSVKKSVKQKTSTSSTATSASATVDTNIQDDGERDRKRQRDLTHPSTSAENSANELLVTQESSQSSSAQEASARKKTASEEQTYSVFKIPIRMEIHEEATGVDVEAYLASNPCRCHFGGPCICAELGNTSSRKKQSKNATSMARSISKDTQISQSSTITNPVLAPLGTASASPLPVISTRVEANETVLASALVSLHYQPVTPVNQSLPSIACGCGCKDSTSCCTIPAPSCSKDIEPASTCCSQSHSKRQQGIQLPPLASVLSQSCEIDILPYPRLSPPKIPVVQKGTLGSSSDCGCQHRGCCVNTESGNLVCCCLSVEAVQSVTRMETPVGRRLCCCG